MIKLVMFITELLSDSKKSNDGQSYTHKALCWLCLLSHSFYLNSPREIKVKADGLLESTFSSNSSMKVQ